MTNLDKLKFYLQEDNFPYFADSELQFLLEVNKNNPLLAASQGCLIKSNADKKIKVGSIEIEGGEKEYWLSLKAQYDNQYNNENKGGSGPYKNIMRRVDIP